MLYNGPEETCLRALILLEAAHPVAMSAEELSPFDHAVVHTGDFWGPASLHAALPGRGGEIEVRRRLLAPALALGHEVGMLDRIEEDGVVRYGAGDDLPSNLRMEFGGYGDGLAERAEWLFGRFGGGSAEGRLDLVREIEDRDGRLLLEADAAGDVSEEEAQVRRFELLDAVYASDHGRMETLAHAAEAMSVWRFVLRRRALREAGDPSAGTMRHEIEPEMLALRTAALAERAKVEAQRRGLAETLAELRGRAGA